VSLFGGVVCAVQIAVALCSLFPTELALKKAFDECGNRR